jgi:hypothetical protein
VAVAAALAAAALAADATPPLFGKIKSVAKDGASFELAEKRGTLKLTVEESTAIVAHRYVVAKDCSGGAAHVLGKKQPPQVNPQTGARSGPSIAPVFVVVVGDFQPPAPIPPDLAEQKLEWISGHLQVGVQLALDGTHLGCGTDRKVIVVEAADKAALAKAKNRPALVEATLTDPKAKEGAAQRVTLLAPDCPAAELRAILPPQ